MAAFLVSYFKRGQAETGPRCFYFAPNHVVRGLSCGTHKTFPAKSLGRSLSRFVSTSTLLSLSESWLALAGCWCFRFGGGNQTIANSSLAGELASAANGVRFLPHLSFRRLFIGGPELHLSEYSLALHFFLQKFQCLVDVIVADCNEQNISNLTLANRRRGT